ncbi:MAG: L,D-transpeptidase family protein [Acidimicrobiales bacterium]
MTPAHRKSSPGDGDLPRPPSLLRRASIAGAAVVGAGALVAGVLAAQGSGTPPSPTVSASNTSPSNTGQPSGGSAGTTTTTTLLPVVPLQVAAVHPRPSAHELAVDGVITVAFSAPLKGSEPTPRLNPPVAGHWTVSGSTLTFHPTGGFVPYSHEALTVPAGVTASEGGRSVSLASAYHVRFQVGTGSWLRLQQLLTELRYLPLTFTPGTSATATGYTSSASSTTSATTATSTTASSTTATTPLSALQQEPTTAGAVSTAPLPGSFTWAYHNVPASLVQAWAPGKDNVLTRGAVMAFESDNNLAVDGVAGPQVWSTLRHDVAARNLDPHPYNYLMVNETGTEYLKVWSDGRVVYTTLVNTGVPGATTQPGIFPVYLRYEHQNMKGTDVNGTKYDVPVSWVSYFNGGDAVHGYYRSGYGYPQSNGCVELPISNAQMLWTSSQGYDGYGVLVDVSSGPVT